MNELLYALAVTAVVQSAAWLGYLLGRTERPGDRETVGPEDRKTGRPEDRRTRGPEDRRTVGPEDRETGRPPLVRVGPGGDYTRDYRPGERLDLTA